MRIVIVTRELRENIVGCLIFPYLQDCTGEYVTAEKLYAVILGDKSKVKGGSGKVINSKPEDRIFIYYSDHGGPGGVLGNLLILLLY